MTKESKELYDFINDYIEQNQMPVVDAIGVLEMIKLEIAMIAYESLGDDDEQ